MGNKARFATDLYQGTAEHYERYRLPYPTTMLTHLVSGAHLSGRGRLLDLPAGPANSPSRWAHTSQKYGP